MHQRRDRRGGSAADLADGRFPLQDCCGIGAIRPQPAEHTAGPPGARMLSIQHREELAEAKTHRARQLDIAALNLHGDERQV